MHYLSPTPFALNPLCQHCSPDTAVRDWLGAESCTSRLLGIADRLWTSNSRTGGNWQYRRWTRRLQPAIASCQENAIYIMASIDKSRLCLFAVVGCRR